MPVKIKHLLGATQPVAHSKANRSRAFKVGAKAYRDGRTLEAYPQEYKPVIGDSVLFDDFRHGWLTAQAAELRPQAARY